MWGSILPQEKEENSTRLRTMNIPISMLCGGNDDDETSLPPIIIAPTLKRRRRSASSRSSVALLLSSGSLWMLLFVPTASFLMGVSESSVLLPTSSTATTTTFLPNTTQRRLLQVTNSKEYTTTTSTSGSSRNLKTTIVAFSNKAATKTSIRSSTTTITPSTSSSSNSYSWSKPGYYSASSSSSSDNSSSSSRFGVRKRVKAVLEKARNRTGLSNRNSDASIVAEAASLGGLAESANLIVASSSSSSINAPTTMNGYRNSYSNILNGKLNDAATTTTEQALQEMQGRGPLRNVTDVDLIPEQSPTSSSTIGNGLSISNNNRRIDVDAVLNSGKVESLPFQLPTLTSSQREQLAAGERIQEQSKMGREGSGYVVLDVKAPDYIVWECLLDFEKYPEYIGTVRSMQMFTNTHLKQSYIAEQPVLPGTGRETRHYGKASVTRAKFVLSKFQLNIAAVHKYRPHPDGHYMEFTLDEACRNVVLKDAKGIWYTESNPDGRTGYTRIWLLCELTVSPILPTFIVDYTAKRAMPRASTWITPAVDAMKKEFRISDGDAENVAF